MATLAINGEQKTFEAPDNMPLLWVLQQALWNSFLSWVRWSEDW